MSSREVCLAGGSPWGFRMHGGQDQHQALRISRVNPGSKAAQQGVREGDLISSINGKSTRELSNGEAHALLRNAGDQLKLGLNQETGSPKRRIYKSSLQENSSIETIKKTTTTKTTTTNTHIISTELKKNGIDETKNEPSYEKQNGNLKTETPAATAADQQDKSDSDKNHFSSVDHLDYATESESTSCLGIKMPCGSRTRRNRRNNRQRKSSQPTSSVSEDASNGSQSTEVTEKEETTTIPSSDPENNAGPEEHAEETKIDGSSLTITTEQSLDELPYVNNLSAARSRLGISNRHTIEKRVLHTDTQICEITTIRSAEPLEARIDHIPGVGIVESTKELSPNKNVSSNVTVSEPAEPVEPLPEDLATKVENLPGAEACMTVAVPIKRFDFLEIHEMTDSDVELDCKSAKLQQQEGIIIEVESDLEREPSFEEKKKDDSEVEGVDDSITWELEKQLRSFIEGLKLPSSSAEKAPRNAKFLESDVNLGGRDVRGSVKSPRKRVATSLGSYQSQMSQESNRCLDIIQEEGETKCVDDSESGQQHIRDFINEEIGKFRREPRDLKSVLRDQRNSLEGREEEKSAIGVMECEDVKKNSAETELNKNIDVDGKDKNIRVESPNKIHEERNSKNECQRDCDDNVGDKKVVEKETVSVLPDENVEMIRNLVENLTERVINETDFEKKGDSNHTNDSPCQDETEKIETETQCVQEATVSDKLRNAEDEEIEEIIRLDSDREFDDDFIDEDDATKHSIVIIDMANRNSSFEDDWDESENSFSEAVLKDEDFGKNLSEACNEVSSHPENQFDVRNDNPKITNETCKNDEKVDENNDDISNESLKNCNDSNSVFDHKNVSSVENNSADSDTEKSIEDVEIFDLPEGSIQNDPRAFLPFFIRGFPGRERFIPFNVKRRTNYDEDGYLPLTITEILDDNDEEYQGLEVVKSKHFPVTESFEFLERENEKNLNEENEVNSEHELSSADEEKNEVAPSDEINENFESKIHLLTERENVRNMENTQTEKIIETENRSSTERIDENKTKHQTTDELSGEDKKTEKTVDSEADKKPTNTKIFTDPVSDIKLSNSAESQCQEPITLDTLEHLAAKITQIQERAPDPPKRSASLHQSNSSSEIPRNDRAPYIERIPPPPPTRCRRSVPAHDTRYPTEFPHCPGPAPKFAVFHQRTLNAFDFNDQLETVEFVRALLTILSNHNSTRQDVQNFLQQYDLDKLPANIRNIVDDLMAPTPSLSSENSIELSEGCVDLCNDLRIEPQRDDYKIGTGRVSAPPEIAANKSQRSRDGAAHCEKPGESTHTEEYDLPRPSNKLFKTSEERTYETYTENTTQTIRKETKITWGPEAMFANERLADDVSPAGLHTHQNSSGSEHIPDAGPGGAPKSTLLNGATPAGDHLYYVPQANPSFDPDGNSAGKFSEGQADPPDTLRELCVKKILSMPCGEKLIDEISVPKFNIFRSLKTSSESIKSKEPSKPYDRAAKHNGYTKADLLWTRKKPEAEISSPKPTTWAGVPTKENPKLLVCLSPAQQKTNMKTSADNLLDLHKKFINRHGYHVEHTHSVSPPKYHIDVTPKAPELPPKPTNSSSRLMNIIKDNPVAGQDQLTNGQHGHECDNQEWLRAARLNDWLSPARYDNGRPSGDVLIEPHHQGNEWTDKRQGEQRRVNGALIEPGPPPPTRNVTPTLRRSPLTFNSAIIDKSPENTPSRPPSAMGRASVDPNYVNSALIIGTKPEVPPRAKRTVTVDRDCIDTRSLFDQGPSGPAPKPKEVKQQTAQEIMNNLKQLQIDTKDHVDKRRRYSLPQEYFEKQMKYIEQLENQLHEEILTKVEEEKQLEGTEKPKKTRPVIITESSFLDCPAYRLRQALHQNGDKNVDDCITERDRWRETSNKDEGGNSEYESREGSRETRKKLETGEGFYSESIEKREEQSVTSKSVVKSRRPKVERPVTIAAIPTNGETFRQAMYAEYVREVQEREQRRQHKLIKISSRGELATRKPVKRGEDYSCLNRVEQEFIEKAKSRLGKHGIRLDESDTEGSGSEPQPADAARLIVDGQELRHANKLPKHLREFLALERENHEMIAPKFKASSATPGVWSPGSDSTKPLRQASPERGNNEKDEAIPPVWTPSSAGPSPVPERKEFRPVPFESPVLSRKKIQQQQQQQPRRTDTSSPSWQAAEQRRGASQAASPGIPSRIVNSYSAPSQGLNALSGAPRLPRAQNPTITLLQKAREGQLPKGASYLEETDHSSPSRTEEKPLVSPGEVIYTLKKEYESEPETKNDPPKRMADLGPRKYKGIGPTTRGGMPIVLKSEVNESNQERWYKQMYNSLHRVPKKDDYVTIHYKPHRGTKTGYSGTSSGYLSEPEPIRSYPDRSATLDSRRHRQRNKENDFSTSTLPRPAGRMNGHYSPDTYHMNPGRIEDYEPGNSSIQDKETKEPSSDLSWAKRKWWDEVMDIFDGWLDENNHQTGLESGGPGRLQVHSRPGASGQPYAPSLKVRREAEQARLRQSRLLESLFELGGSRPRSGSAGGDWASLILARAAAAQSAGATSSASSSSSVTNSSSNGTSCHAAVATPNKARSLLPFEQPSRHSPKSYMTHALKESGYESDSTLVFRRREDASPLSPIEQRIAYKTVQKGGDVPLHGLRKLAPERPKDDTEIEYFPISPTPTRIRVCRRSSCSSPASSTSSMNISRIPVSSMASRRAAFKSSNSPLLRKTVVANGAKSSSLNNKVPAPPKRKSSRNSRTLKLYSTSLAKSVDSAHSLNGRHDQCFVEEQLSNIRILKEKLNTNLERHRKDREETQKQRLIRGSSASPVSSTRRPITSLEARKRRAESLTRSPCSSRDLLLSTRSRLSSSASPVGRFPKIPLVRKSPDIKSTISRTSSRTSVSGSPDRACHHISRPKTTSIGLKKEQKIRRLKKEQEESCRRLSGSKTDLSSPLRIQKTLPKSKDRDRFTKTINTKVLPGGTIIKSSSAAYTSSIGSNKIKVDDKLLKVTVSISPEGREILKKGQDTVKSTSIACKHSTSVNMNDSRRKRAKEKSLIQKSESRQSISDRARSRREVKSRSMCQMTQKYKPTSKSSDKNAEFDRLRNIEKMTQSESISPTLTVDLLRQHHEATMSDSFFQHLFLREVVLSTSQINPLRKSSVLDRARIFQDIDYGDSFKSEPSLKSLSTYLAYKRPVSNSRFKYWERESLSSRSSSPYGMKPSLPRFNQYESLLNVDEFGSTSSLRVRSPDLTRECPKERSLSEPPLKSPRGSPVSSDHRSQSPSPVRSPSSRKIQGLRQDNAIDGLLKKFRAKSTSEMDYKQNFGSNLSLARSTNSLMNIPIVREDYQQYILERLHSKQKSKRYKDLYEFYTSLERLGDLEKTTSTNELRPRLKNEEIIDYERWKQIRNMEKAEQELKALYRRLKLVQKEKDFLFSTRDVDRDKWRGDSSLRCKERSVESIREQFCKLKNEESELEASRQRDIASKKDTYKPLWRGSSVVNVANTMTKKAADKAESDRSSMQASLQKSLGGSNKFWSSLSIEQVTALKNQLNDIYGNDTINPKKSKNLNQSSNVPVAFGKDDSSETHNNHFEESAYKRRRRDALVSDSDQSSMSVSDYEIVVSKRKREVSPDEHLGLHVRCHSMIVPDRPKPSEETDAMKRSGSISRVSSLDRSQSEHMRCSSPMSESEKKRLSLTLGKEMLEKVSQKLSSSMVQPRETRGALAVAMAKSTSSVLPRTYSAIDAPTSENTFKARNDNIFILAPNDVDPEQKKRVREVMKELPKKASIPVKTKAEGVDQVDSATESSDTSVRTVVRRSSECEDNLFKKVEFFEKIEKSKISQAKKSNAAPKLSSAQSFADLKELFGESWAARSRDIPLYKPRSRSTSPPREVEQSNSDRGRSSSASPDVVASTRAARPESRDGRPRSVSPYRGGSPSNCCYDSYENLWQRCGSPDPEKYWRTYLKLVRDGTVSRLRAKFESLEELSHSSRRKIGLIPKRFQSDPELARNLLKKVTDPSKNYIKPQEIPDVAWLRRKYEQPRGRRRKGSPIPRVPWRLEDLNMPHINVISKTAELKESANRKLTNLVARKEETRELESKRAVNRLREMFERSSSPSSKTSILEYTNAPPPPPPKAQHYRGERQESPRRYVEGEVTIHYRSPVRSEAKEPLSEEELARRSAENMRRVYQEERRRKYLQELHDIDSRRHTDNFIPSQKSPIPLNRYDDFVDDLSYRSRSQEQTPEPRLVARALYNFVGQSPRELTFRRGDIIFVRRQVDRNWYEGEHNAMVGLFPFNYVEILPFDEIRTPPKKSYEGQARAKFNFVAQTNLELSLAKGELVYLLRRVDENWWEGRLGPHGRKGIFPVSYVDVITEPGYRPETPVQSKPAASPAAHSLLSNGSSGGKLSMGPHHYSPSLPVNINATQPHYNSLPKGGNKYVAPVNETLHIDTHSEPIPYRALYNYRPQNEDELELSEGDTVYVMEKCDDGWYVGSSQRTGYFGTFPGNYVERL